MGQKDYIPIRKLKTKLPNNVINNIVKDDGIDIVEDKVHSKIEVPVLHVQKAISEKEILHDNTETPTYADIDEEEPKKFTSLKLVGLVILLIFILVLTLLGLLDRILNDSASNSNKADLYDYEVDYENLKEVFGEDALIIAGKLEGSPAKLMMEIKEEKHSGYVDKFINAIIRNNVSYSDIITQMNYNQTAGFLQLIIDRIAVDYLKSAKMKVTIDEDMLIFCDISSNGKELIINPRLIDAGLVDFNEAIESLLRTFLLKEDIEYKLESSSFSEITFKAEQGDHKVTLEIDRSPGIERYEADSPKTIRLDLNKIVYKFGIPTYPGFGKLASIFSKGVESFYLPGNEGGTYRTIEVIFDGSTYEFSDIEVLYNSSNIFSRAELVTNGNVETLPKRPYVSRGFHYSIPFASKHEHIYIPFKSGQSLRVVDEMGTIIHPEITMKDFDFKLVEDELKLNMTPVEISKDGIVFSIDANHFENNVWICAEYGDYSKNLCSKMYDEATNKKSYTFPREGVSKQDFKLEAGKEYIFYLRYSIKDEDRSLAKALFEEEIDPSTDVSIVIHQVPFIVAIPLGVQDGNSDGSGDSDSSGK